MAVRARRGRDIPIQIRRESPLRSRARRRSLLRVSTTAEVRPGRSTAALRGGALAYAVLETVAGWVTLTVVATVALIPAWLLIWPRLERRILPLAGHPAPLVRRTSRFELRWRDWALVLVTPVAGFLGVAAIGLGVVLPILLIVAPLRVAVTGRPVTILLATIDSPAGQALAAAIGASVLVVATWGVSRLAYLWGRLTSALLSDEERRLAEQVATLSEDAATRLDQVALERRQLERDLHDGAQMHLGAAALRLATLQLDVDELPPTSSQAAVVAGVRAVREELAAAATAIRTSVRGLVPTTLDREGLCAALTGATANLPIATRLRCDVPRLHPATEAGLFLIASEAIANVARHARATALEIELTAQGQAVALQIADDGRGGASPTGTGLVSIQARARLLGGEARIDSPHGRGTTITVTVAGRRPEAASTEDGDP